jgi:hypothetical protein
MKGIELPINILVMVAIAVIVLLGMVALYYVGSGQFGRSVTIQAAQNDACGVMVRSNCASDSNSIEINNFDANMNGKIGDDEEGSGWTWGTAGDVCGTNSEGGDNLAALCACYAGRTTEAQCKQLCGCQ